MPYEVVSTTDGTTRLTMGSDVYGTFTADNQGNLKISAIPGAMTNVNFVMATGTMTGTASRLKSSTTGSTWQDIDLTSVDFTGGGDVAFDGQTTWVAAGRGSSGAKFIYSSDNLNWSQTFQNNIMGSGLWGVCYAPDTYWYAVGYDMCGANTIIRSTNKSDPSVWDLEAGTRLTPGSAYFDNYYPGEPGAGIAIATDGDRTIVAVGVGGPSNSGILWADTGADGKMWSNATFQDGSWIRYWSNQVSAPSPSAIVAGVGFNGTLWVAAGNCGILVSRDGKTWKSAANPYGFNGQCVAWNGQYWIVGGVNYYNVAGTSAIYYSYDGFTWEPATTPSGVWIQAICWNGTYWIAGGQGLNGFGVFSPDAPPSSFIKSSDGVNWEGTAGGASGQEFDQQVNAIANRILLPYSSLPGSVVTHTGIGVPSPRLGNAGDFYYDKNTFGLYGPKIEYEDIGSNGSIFFPTRFENLTSVSSADFLLTGDFTINFWANIYSQGGSIFDVPSGLPAPGEPGSFSLGVTGTSLLLSIDASTNTIANSVTPNQWTYYTMLRSSTSGLMVYSNGTNVLSNDGFKTNTIGNSSNGVNIGGGLYGLLTNFRWVKGYVDTSAGSVPTEPLTAITGTKMLLLAKANLSLSSPQQSFIDSTGNYTLTVGGNVMWSGDNPFQSTVESWGNAIFPPIQRTIPNTYYGSGVPTTPPSGSQRGDIYYDTSTSPPTKYIIN